jgi:hypothetical protein
MSADAILDALIAASDDRIWATELALLSGGRRVDFWTLEPAASRGFRATAYEIKVSRADFKRDNDDKQSAALRWSDQFWYVTPISLLRKDEVPSWAGLLEWNGSAFRIAKKAPMRIKEAPDWEFVVSLLRNAGDSRRDVGLLKAQVAFLQAATEADKRRERQRNQWNMDRWIRRAKAKRKGSG